jgi:hypothetical protein
MKIGTIIRNDWAGDRNPTKYFIYTGISGEYATGIALNNGNIKRLRFGKKDFVNDGKFVPVGYCGFADLIKADLMKYQPAKEATK